MNANDEVNALLGKRGGNPAEGSAEYWKQKFEESEHKLHSAQVEQGRVKSLDARYKELEKENAMLKEKLGATNAVSQLTPEERGDIPEEYLGAAAKIAGRATSAAMAGMTSELERLKQEREAERAAAQKQRANEFVNWINKKFPGFLATISEGGDKHKAWESFLEHNAASVQQAFDSCDYDALAYHVERFYKESLGIRPPEGGGTSASVPEPVSHNGGTPSVDANAEKTYTSEEYDKLDEKCAKLRRAGNFEEYRKLRDELDSALSEGRVKD